MKLHSLFLNTMFGILIVLMARPAVKSALAMSDLHFETVNAGGYSYGRYRTVSSLAFDNNGYPGIITYVNGKWLYYYKWNGSSWTSELVLWHGTATGHGYGASLTYDSSGKAHVAVAADDTTNKNYVFLRRDGNKDLGSCTGFSQDGDWGCEFIATAPSDSNDAYTSIRIMPASPFTAAFAFTGSDNSLYYARRVDCGKVDCCTDTNWTCEQVDAADYGLTPALDFDSSNEAHIAYRYQSGTDHEIMFARRNGNHTGCAGSDDDEWECDSVITGTPYSTTAYNTTADMGLKSDGTPVVAIYGDDEDECTLCDSSDGGDTWSCSLLYSGTAIDKYPVSLVITDEDLVYVAWSKVGGSYDLWGAIPNQDGDGTGCAAGVTDWDCGAFHTSSLSGQWVSIDFYGGSSARHVGIIHWNNSAYDLMYTHAPTIDVRINEIQYDPTEELVVDTDTSSDVEDCSGAPIDLAEWTPGSAASTTISDSTASATDDIYECVAYSCWSGDDAAEHLYRFVPPVDMDLQIDLIGSSYDTKAAIVTPCIDLSPWTPADITTERWFDASDEDTIIGYPVNTWEDKSGNGNDITQSTSYKKPYSGDASHDINGLNVIKFIQGDSLQTTALNNPSEVTVFMLFRATNVSQSGRPYYTSESNSGDLLFGISTTSGLYLVNGASLYSSHIPSLDDVVLLSALYNGTSSEIWIDGDSKNSGNAGSDSSSGITLGANASGSGYTSLDIAEFVSVDSISSANREKMEGYLAHKWGQEGNLPEAHPYKTHPPTTGDTTTTTCLYNDDYSGTDSGWACQSFTGGTTYYVNVSGSGGATGSYSLNIDECGTASGSDTNGDDEWVELYVARSGNLADVQFTTNDGETAFDLPTVDVDRGEYVVVAVGSGTDDTTGPQYIVNWGEKVERLDNTGDDVSVFIEPWSAAAECHNYVSYGIETGGAIDDPGSGCDFDGTYPSCVTCNTNPVSAAENYSVSLGPDGKTGDVVANWEQSGAAGDPATYGPKTFGITNMAAPTPARLAGMWTEPGAAGGVLISWTTLSEIETLATRPVRWTGSDWVPVCEWHMASRNSFFGTHMTAFDETGFDGDLYAIEEIDNAGTRRIVPAPALQPQAPMVKTLAPLRKGMANSTRPVPRHVPAAPDKCRLEADGPGWVNVTSKTLLEMCPETESWSEIRIQKLGRTIPGNWTGDGLEFFATAPSNRYERHEIYELSNGPGHSFGEADGAPLDYGEDVYALPLTVRFEQERVYHIGSTEWDHFYWDFFGTGLPLEVTLESGGEVERLLVHVAGVTEGIHGLEAWLGTTFIGRGSFEGRVAATVEFWLDGLNIPPGTPLELHATGPGELDYQYLGAVEMDVQKTLRCGMDLAVPNNFEGTLNVECDFEDVTAYDVTDPNKPVRLVGMESEPQAEGTLARIGLAASESVRTIRVVETGTSVTTQLFPAVPMDTPTGVDYLVIADPDLQKGIAPLLAHREQQGLKTAVVGMDAVRDGHGHGYNDPAAVSNFLTALSQNGSLPRYLLLVGAATLDPRGYLGTGAKNSVPTGFATKAFYGYEMPSDDELIPPALRNKIAVGRIPARSLETLGVYVDKLLAFDGNKAGRALLLRDGSDPGLFNPIADELYKEHLDRSPFDTRVESVGAGAFVSDALAPHVGQTLDLLIYAGHGQLQGWGTHLGLADLATFPEVVWTLGVSLDCYDGHFANPNGETLAWEMLLLEGRGPLTAYVPGTVVAPGEHLFAGKALMNWINREAPSTVGDVVLQAENEMRGMGGVQANLASGFNLLGDPATRWPGFPASAVPDGQTGTDDTDTGNDDGFDAADHSTENCNCRAPGALQNILTLLLKLI